MAKRMGVSRRRLGRTQWRELLARYEASGGSVAAFCARESVSPASFYRWRGLLGKVPSKTAVVANDTTIPGFVEVGSVAMGGAAARSRLELRLELGGGLVLQLVRG